jgi:hypothetical protein
LVEAIVGSGLRDSLEKIDRWNCNISGEEFKDMFKIHEVENIWIEE